MCRSKLLVLFLISSTAVACGEGAIDAPDATTIELEGGLVQTQINASDKERWVYFDLDDPSAEDPESQGWDLAFRRQVIDLNDDADVAISVVKKQDVADVSGEPAADSWLQDTSDEENDLAFAQEGGWYTYNIIVHKLNPKDRTYVVRSNEGTLYKLGFTSYYDEDGNSGFPTFTWGVLDGEGTIDIEPEECVVEDTIIEAIGDHDNISQGVLETQEQDGVISATLDAGLMGPQNAAESSYLYMDIASGELLDLSDQQARESKTWQLAIKRSELRVNSGDSGPGQVQVFLAEDATFADAMSPALDDPAWRTDDFVDDQCNVTTFGLDFIETAFGQWYDYDFETHIPTARTNVVYFIQDKERGELYKLAIKDYKDAIYSLEWQVIE